MSDVDDWTGVSAGATQLIDSGAVTLAGSAGSYTATITIPDVPQTTRSMLVLGYYTPGPQNNLGPGSFNIQGQTSLLHWYSTTAILTDQGTTSFIGGQAMYPLYVPFYGQVDSEAVLKFGASNAGTLDYWVLALPDADILGSSPIPVAVTNPNFTLVAEVDPQPLYVAPGAGQAGGSPVMPVILQDSAGNQQGTSAHPLIAETEAAVTGSSSAVQVCNSGTSATLLAAPPAGQCYEIQNLVVWSGGAVTAYAQALIRSLSSNVPYVAATGPTGSAPFANLGTRFRITEGLQAINVGGGVPFGFTVAYAQIPVGS